MKKVLVLLSIILTTAFSYAAKKGESVNAFREKAKSGFSIGVFDMKNINGTLKFSYPAGCTVTITASLGYSSTYVQASCSSHKKHVTWR